MPIRWRRNLIFPLSQYTESRLLITCKSHASTAVGTGIGSHVPYGRPYADGTPSPLHPANTGARAAVSSGVPGSSQAVRSILAAAVSTGSAIQTCRPGRSTPAGRQPALLSQYITHHRPGGFIQRRTGPPRHPAETPPPIPPPPSAHSTTIQGSHKPAETPPPKPPPIAPPGSYRPAETPPPILPPPSAHSTTIQGSYTNT